MDPPLWISPEYLYILDWFWELRSYVGDRENPISPGLMTDWQAGKGFLLSVWQRDTLHAMDVKFRDTLAAEIANNEKARAASEARKAKGAR